MLSSLLDKIRAPPQDEDHYNRLESTLEEHMMELITQQHLIKKPLMELMESDKQTVETSTTSSSSLSSNGFAMGLTYLATAIVLSESPIESESATLVVKTVEHHLLAPNSTAYNQLRGHQLTLERFEALLRGYIHIILERVDVGNYRRILYYLHEAAVRFTPSSQSLSVAHPLLVREASHLNCPSPALHVMSQSVLDISPNDTGAGVIHFYHYFYEGGMLLAKLHCWQDAVLWLRSVLLLPQRALRGTIIASKHAEMDTVLLRARKALIVISIIAHGEFADPVDRKHAKHIMMHPFNRDSTEPYVRLLSAASRRDGKMWETVEKQFISLWQQDEMMEFVMEAGQRLRRHVICDLAKVANRVYMKDIISTLHKHGLYTPSGEIDNTNTNTNTISSINEADVIDLLLTMQEEGELLVNLEYIKSTTDEHNSNNSSNTTRDAENEIELSNTKEINNETLVVRLAIPPARVPIALGNCCKGVDVICLSDAERKRLVQAQLRRALEERVERCERARQALMQATALTGLGEKEISGREGKRGVHGRKNTHLDNNEEMESHLNHGARL